MNKKEKKKKRKKRMSMHEARIIYKLYHKPRLSLKFLCKELNSNPTYGYLSHILMGMKIKNWVRVGDRALGSKYSINPKYQDRLYKKAIERLKQIYKPKKEESKRYDE